MQRLLCFNRGIPFSAAARQGKEKISFGCQFLRQIGIDVMAAVGIHDQFAMGKAAGGAHHQCRGADGIFRSAEDEDPNATARRDRRLARLSARQTVKAAVSGPEV